MSNTNNIFNFSDSEREIFPYHDGINPRFGDPLELRRRLAYTLPDANTLIQNYDLAGMIVAGKDNEAAQYARQRAADPTLPEKSFELNDDEKAKIKFGQAAHEKLCAGIRSVFELKDFDPLTGKGCTERMVISIWNHYNAWLTKKNGVSPQPPTP